MAIIFKLAVLILIFAGLVMGYEGFKDQDLVEVLVGQNSQWEFIIDCTFGGAAIIAALGLLTGRI